MINNYGEGIWLSDRLVEQDFTTGERREYRAATFVLDKRQPVTLPDSRPKEIIEMDAKDLIERAHNCEVALIRRVETKLPFDGIFKDVFQVFIRNKGVL